MVAVWVAVGAEVAEVMVGAGVTGAVTVVVAVGVTVVVWVVVVVAPATRIATLVEATVAIGVTAGGRRTMTRRRRLLLPRSGSGVKSRTASEAGPLLKSWSRAGAWTGAKSRLWSRSGAYKERT